MMGKKSLDWKNLRLWCEIKLRLQYLDMDRYTLPAPWYAYCCGITFDEELGHTYCQLSDYSAKDASHNDECGEYKIRAVPLKHLTQEDKDGYDIDYDYEMRVAKCAGGLAAKSGTHSFARACLWLG